MFLYYLSNISCLRVLYLPDVFCESVAYTWDHADNGLVADLTPLEEALGEDYMWEATHNLGIRYPDVEGAMYAVPFRTAGELIFYNKDIFDAAGNLIISGRIPRDGIRPGEGGQEIGYVYVPLWG